MRHLNQSWLHGAGETELGTKYESELLKKRGWEMALKPRASMPRLTMDEGTCA